MDAVLAAKVDQAQLKAKRGGRHEEQAMSSSSGSSARSSDSELSSILLRDGNTTILDAVHVVPANVLIADVEAGHADESIEVSPPSVDSEAAVIVDEQSTSEGILTSVPDIESPPVSGDKLRSSKGKQ